MRRENPIDSKTAIVKYMEKTEYYPGIKRYIASKVQNPEDAEDLAQSVFLEFYRGNHNGENPEPYLFGIARNLIASYYRQNGKQPGILRLNAKIADEIAFEDYNSVSKTRYLAEEIETVVFELPPKAREAVELRLIDDLSSQEAASQMGCTVDRFYDRFYEGLKIIKKGFASKSLERKELSEKRRET